MSIVHTVHLPVLSLYKCITWYHCFEVIHAHDDDRTKDVSNESLKIVESSVFREVRSCTMSGYGIDPLEPFFSGLWTKFWCVIHPSETGKSQWRHIESEMYGYWPLFELCCFMLPPPKKGGAMFSVCLLHTERNPYKGREPCFRRGRAVQSCIVPHRVWPSFVTENDCS